ncbi:MAG: hypothetical protein Ct9H300mP1_19450 [Planctomycetaceae bacterium]|nr:MAG: hypothetical protein Ct9H300mP1_19450 [Planctomycetaceae bacterium]
MDAQVSSDDLDRRHFAGGGSMMVGVDEIPAGSRPDLLEISDLIVDFDIETMSRRPVNRDEVVERLSMVGDRPAARIVAGMPANDGVLDPDAVDRLLIRVHCEMQRLSEEFQHGRRVFEFLASLRAALDQAGVPPPYRIVDIGCGTGYVIRWLSALAVFSTGGRVDRRRLQRGSGSRGTTVECR